MWFILFAQAAAFGNPIDIALEEVASCALHNQADLFVLFEMAQPESFTELSQSLLDSADQERTALMALKRQHSGSFLLETGIQKCMGLLDESVSKLKQIHSWGEVDPSKLKPRDHDITALKFLLLMLLLQQPDIDPNHIPLRFLYGAPVGESKSKLVWDAHFHIPNCGYVFGGRPLKQLNHGLDCSSFAGLCIQYPGRLTTAWLKAKLTEMKKNQYHPFSLLKLEELEPGDLVFWRHSHRGHVLLFQFWLFYPHVYQGIEATRSRKGEGIRITRFDFASMGSKVCHFVRYKGPKSMPTPLLQDG